MMEQTRAMMVLPKTSASMAGLCATVAFALACPSAAPTPETPPDCDEVVTVANDQLVSRVERFAGTCVDNDDCAVAHHQGRCDDGSLFSAGSMAYSAVFEAEVEAAFAQDEADLCAEFRTCNVSFNLDTFVVYGYCDAGVCRGSTRHPDDFCPRRAGAFSEFVEVRLGQIDAQSRCASVDDCVMGDVEMVCDGGDHLVGCPLPMHRDTVTQVLPGLFRDFDQQGCTPQVFSCDVVDDTCAGGALQCEGGVCVSR